MKRFVGQAFYRAYRELIANRVRQIPFWMLVGFLPTFIIARFLVDHFPNYFVSIHGVHVHHYTWGFFVLAIVGFISLVSPHYPPRPPLAMAYGMGLALAFDEFGMWVHLTSNYRLDQSEDVMVGILVFLVAIVYLTGLVRATFKYLRR